eukprot:3923793-Amphidinium_carterae.1
MDSVDQATSLRQLGCCSGTLSFCSLQGELGLGPEIIERMSENAKTLSKTRKNKNFPQLAPKSDVQRPALPDPHPKSSQTTIATHTYKCIVFIFCCCRVVIFYVLNISKDAYSTCPAQSPLMCMCPQQPTRLIECRLTTAASVAPHQSTAPGILCVDVHKAAVDSPKCTPKSRGLRAPRGSVVVECACEADGGKAVTGGVDSQAPCLLLSLQDGAEVDWTREEGVHNNSSNAI